MNSKKANELIVKGLKELNANPIKNGEQTRWYIRTIYGMLSVCLSESNFCRGKNGVMSCFSRFEQPELAKDHLDCNPYSGKWNWCRWAKDFTNESFADMVINDIKKILPKT